MWWGDAVRVKVPWKMQSKCCFVKKKGRVCQEGAILEAQGTLQFKSIRSQLEGNLGLVMFVLVK